MSGHTYIHTYIHTYTQTYTHDNYYNPRCACAPRVNYSRLLHVHMQRYNNANCAGTRFYKCLIHMHANWCFQSKYSNISAEGLHFSAFH